MNPGNTDNLHYITMCVCFLMKSCYTVVLFFWIKLHSWGLQYGFIYMLFLSGWTIFYLSETQQEVKSLGLQITSSKELKNDKSRIRYELHHKSQKIDFIFISFTWRRQQFNALHLHNASSTKRISATASTTQYTMWSQNRMVYHKGNHRKLGTTETRPF